jgi:hypothetical protein
VKQRAPCRQIRGPILQLHLESLFHVHLSGLVTAVCTEGSNAKNMRSARNKLKLARGFLTRHDSLNCGNPSIAPIILQTQCVVRCIAACPQLGQLSLRAELGESLASVRALKNGVVLHLDTFANVGCCPPLVKRLSDTFQRLRRCARSTR